MTVEQTRMQREHVWREILQDQVSRHWLTSIIRILLRSPRRWFWSYRSCAVCKSGFYRESDTEHETFRMIIRPRNCFEDSTTGPFASSIKILHHTDPTS